MMALILFLPLHAMVHLHPHQYVYYNEVFGSLPAAEDQFELDYWGNSFKESVLQFNRILQDTNPEKPYKVAICGHPMSSIYFLTKKKAQWHQSLRDADFYIRYSRYWNCPELKGQRRVVQTIRQGVVLSEIYDLRPILEAKPQ